MDPAARRPTREEIEAEVAPFRGRSIEQAWADLRAACKKGMEELANNPDRERILAEEEPPHPSYFEIIRRLRARAVEDPDRSPPTAK